MLYKIIAAALLVSSGEALKITGSVDRRAALGKAMSLAVPLVAAPAFALNRPEDAEIYKNAAEGKLNAARAIERAKVGNLADGASATCNELDELIAVDREAVEFEKEKLEALGTSDPAAAKKVAAAEKKLQDQINKLKKLRKEKGCPSAAANLKQKGDFEVYKRADEGKLNTARAIERAKAGNLVDGSSATCAELEKIIQVDKKALKFEKDKLEAMPDAAQKKIVEEAEKSINAQVAKLEGLRTSKGC